MALLAGGAAACAGAAQHLHATRGRLSRGESAEHACRGPRTRVTHTGTRKRTPRPLCCAAAAASEGARLLVMAMLVLITLARAHVPADQRAALMDLFNATGGPRWLKKQGWGDGDPCAEAWHGIACNGDGTAVTTIDVHSNSLVGTLTPSLATFAPYLVKLDLGENPLSGSLPNFWSGFTSLTAVAISGSVLGGSLPDSVCDMSSLINADFHGNRLNGSLPRCLYRLTQLSGLDVRYNRFEGDVPSLCLGVPGGVPAKLKELNLNGQALTGWDTRTQCPNGVSFTLSAINVEGNNITADLSDNYIWNVIKMPPLRCFGCPTTRASRQRRRAA